MHYRIVEKIRFEIMGNVDSPDAVKVAERIMPEFFKGRTVEHLITIDYDKEKDMTSVEVERRAWVGVGE